MKKNIFLVALVLSLVTTISYAQIGIGTTLPLMKLHIADYDSQVLLLENTAALNTGTETSIYFKTGNSSFTYTGGIKTIGNGTSVARLGFFTYAASSPSGLLERMSILDNGFVGIGISSPSQRLEVAGNLKVNGIISGVADPTADNDAANKKYVDDEISNFPIIYPYNVGDFAQGGIVFWVDETGLHGLVCAPEDQSTGVRWYAGTHGITRATGDGLFSGELNTAIIISSQVSIGDDGNDYAAQKCNDLQVTEGSKTYGDWYLPSKEELNLMYQNKATIDATAVANGAFTIDDSFYWSSTENTNNKAWIQSFDIGDQLTRDKYIGFRVRAVRAF